VSTEERSDNVAVTALRGVGPRIADRLAALGIDSIQDLLFHLPLRYQDRTRLDVIGGLRPGQEAVVSGEIQATQVSFGRRRSLLCVIHDGTGSLTLRFFYFSQSQQKRLTRGERIMCFGEARRGPKGLEMVHPEYRLLDEGEEAPLEDHLTPIYPTTEGMNQTNWRRLTDQALTKLETDATLQDYVPKEILEGEILDTHGFASLEESLLAVHRPPTGADPDDPDSAIGRGRRRLAFDELLAQHLSLRLLRRRLDADAASPMAGDGGRRRRFFETLPFSLTRAPRTSPAPTRCSAWYRAMWDRGRQSSRQRPPCRPSRRATRSPSWRRRSSWPSSISATSSPGSSPWRSRWPGCRAKSPRARGKRL
jgi:ATP-dependent DNA helicase RecG